ncbi:hypothetical protein HELRODRAFT_91416, partial [Helobdella robusta]|uniref:Carboxylesterase type B domain-containing protein n=1 Tax=Helobdella robusta TaxID=6412 RepID=T1G835_HELRO
EDCLYLNIFSPYRASQSKKYPVLFVIHGGSYESGAGHTYNGKVLSLQGVVVVNFNYRLGPLGFLTSNDEILPGNYGLQDVLMALKWVNENIRAFRGDPTKLTLLGHGVGASMAGMLMTMPSTRGVSVYMCVFACVYPIVKL